MFEDKNWFQLIRNRVLRLSDGSIIKQDFLSTLLLINVFAYIIGTINFIWNSGVDKIFRSLISHMLTFINRNGEEEPLYQDYINSILKRIIDKHGLKKITPHGFRHIHATLMIEIGIDPVNTAKRLGHASSQMTLDTYSHTTAVGEVKAINKFANYMNGWKD